MQIVIQIEVHQFFFFFLNPKVHQFFQNCTKERPGKKTQVLSHDRKAQIFSYNLSNLNTLFWCTKENKII